MFDTIPASSAGDFYAPSDAPQVVRHRPQFTGRAGEYFGIWFVNLLLSIVTLGIYSAWAKVRTERYFYANTSLAGSNFEYLASPIQILKGRLMAYAVVIALGVSSRFSIGLYLVLALCIGLLLPALIVWSLRFRARNSAWRGLSFRFDKGAGEAYGPFLLWTWLSSITLSVLYPIMKQRQHEFVVEGHRLGLERFSFRGQAGSYYGPYAIAVGTFIGTIIVLTVVGGIASASGSFGNAAIGSGMIIGIFAMYLGLFALMIYLRVRYANVMWNNTRLDAHKFQSTLRVRDMTWIYASNLVAIVVTIGLAVPWAMVRLARYRAENFSVLVTGSIDEFMAASDSRYGAGGAELVDALDVGLDLGL